MSGGELFQLENGAVLAQWGPMRLNIQAWDNNGPNSTLAAGAGEFAFSLLPRLAPARELFRRGAPSDSKEPAEPLLQRMIAAAAAVHQDDLGPMAAVAGVVADEVAGYLKTAGAEKALVENGGDLAVYLKPGQRAVVGVRQGINEPEPSHRLVLSGDVRSLWGVCSSGFGGRGVTRGIADTALCVAETAAVADAAATAVGNACWVDSPAVRQMSAELIRPDTDIRGIAVTCEVGELASGEIDAALDTALRYSQSLVDEGVLLGAVVGLRGRVVMTAGFDERVTVLEMI